MPMTRRAPAKINLTLEILGRRPDGYHEIMSLMQAISLHDTLTFAPADGITLQGGTDDAPPTENNLVLRAARALDAATGGGHGARITLVKRIPVGAGLGGGSSDAAATLLALNEMWQAGLTGDALEDLAARLGSDVPFFLGTGTALVMGRGEEVSRLDPPPTLWLALAQPAAPLSTPDVYREYARGPAPRPVEQNAFRKIARGFHRRTEPEKALRAIRRGLWNDLQPAAIRLCPDIAEIQAKMGEAGALGTLVCGSGSAVFALAEDEAHARRIAGALAPVAAWTAAAHTISLPTAQEGDEE